MGGGAGPGGARGSWQGRGLHDMNPQTGREYQVSDSDSFIAEVTEEVRRERLFGLLRRYGWIGVLLVLALVGGAAWNEYSKAQRANAAQARGDALLDAISEPDEALRREAVTELTAAEAPDVVTALLGAATTLEAGDPAAAKATLEALAVRGDVPEIYGELAAFKAAMIDTGDAEARRAALSALAAPGRPFWLLAEEQLALMDIAAGETGAAIGRLQRIAEDAGASQGLRDRAQNLMVALDAPLPGGDPVSE